jgi:purine-binding chemotaxis protein CheW
VDDGDFEEPPDTLKGDQRRLIRGAYKLERELLLVLDSDFALNISAHTNGGATRGGGS